VIPPPPPAESDLAAERKPRDEEFDVHGLTHPGRTRSENQDQFLFGTLHRSLRIRVTSLAAPELLELPGERLASLFVVADGVGGSDAGAEASRLALESVATYVTNTMQCYYRLPGTGDDTVRRALADAAQACHETVVARARGLGVASMSTTMTLGLTVWPRLYLLQVGDSRCYRFRDGVLERLTRDQTMAEAMVDIGVLNEEQARRSRFRNVLSSAIGSTSEPVITVHDIRHGDVILACTDGLTLHVPEDRLAARLGTMATAAQVCQALVDDALDGGGGDNVTVLVVRIRVPLNRAA
jgi:protein phosphatase